MTASSSPLHWRGLLSSWFSTIRITRSSGGANGIEIVQAPGGFGPVLRPFSNAGETDVDLNILPLGSGSVNINGSPTVAAFTYDAVGDLLVGTGDGTYDNLAVGSPGTVLVADPSTSTGLAWRSMAFAQGPQGEQGEQGEPGPPGPAGSTGATGAQGPALWMLDDDSREDPPSIRPGEVPLEAQPHARPTIGGPDGVAQRLVTYQTRSPRYWLKNPGTATISNCGMIAAPTITSNTAGGSSSDTATRPYLIVDTAATINLVCSIVSTTAFIRRCFLPTLVMPFHSGTAASQTVVRRWLGFWSTDLSATSTPTTQHTAAFRYATDVDGTAFWRCITCDGASNVTTTTTTIAAGTSAQENIFRIEMDGSLGHVAFYVDDVCVAMHTTNLPGNTTSMFHGASLTNLDATGRVFRLGSITLIHT